MMQEEKQKNRFFHRIWRSGTGLSQFFCTLITLFQVLSMRGFFFSGSFRWMQAQDDGHVLYPVSLSFWEAVNLSGFWPGYLTVLLIIVVPVGAWLFWLYGDRYPMMRLFILSAPLALIFLWATLTAMAGHGIAPRRGFFVQQVFLVCSFVLLMLLAWRERSLSRRAWKLGYFVSLRPLEEKDRPVYETFIQKAELPGPRGPENTQAPFLWDWIFYQGEPVGSIWLEKDPNASCAELGICLISAIYMGQGIAGEAISRMLAQGKQVWNVRAVCTRMDGQNLRARRCCESLGFREVNQVQPDGDVHMKILLE